MHPVCVKCGREMKPVLNGVVVYHPYEHAKPQEKAQEKIGNLTVVNTDVLIEGGWKDGDIDFLVLGDKYQCERCGNEIVTGFGGLMIDYEVKQEWLQKTVFNAKQSGYAIQILRK